MYAATALPSSATETRWELFMPKPPLGRVSRKLTGSCRMGCLRKVSWVVLGLCLPVMSGQQDLPLMRPPPLLMSASAVYGRTLYLEAAIRGGAGINFGTLERACSGFGVLTLRPLPTVAGRGDLARGDANVGETAADADRGDLGEGGCMITKLLTPASTLTSSPPDHAVVWYRTMTTTG